VAPPTGQSALARVPALAKIALGVGVALVTIGVYWFVFYSETAAKIEGALRQKKALADEMAQQQQALASYFADRDELARREQRARDLNKVLPADAQEDAFLSSVQLASNVAGIDLKGFAPQDEQNHSFYAKVPMKLEMTGKFHQIAKFAYELGKVDRIINVENIELTEPRVVGDEVILKGKCLATAFRVKAPKEAQRGAATPGAPAPPGPTGQAPAPAPATPAPAGGSR
jgi:type IV pilus assembly protein PilO